jgi:AraC family transcriptional regulator, regulatory protein of adaptative response / methylated-DNA-[protein]-cysteine methyltransferase
MNEPILFSTGRCALGIALVAKSERGLCALLLGDDARSLAEDLRQRFPQAEVREAPLEPLVSQVATFLAAPAAGLDLALDLRGSEFQKKVWTALQEIPAGSTESYGAIAQRIGAPQSAKEVGEACAANPLAVAIPCHRVVRKDGGLAGYRWGVRRKRALLELEKR